MSWLNYQSGLVSGAIFSPFIFGGGPSAVNPEPMAPFFDFFVIGDGEQSLPHSMMIVDDFKRDILPALPADSAVQQIMRKVLLPNSLSAYLVFMLLPLRRARGTAGATN
ncbi:MAG: hypothetical protein IPL73_15435 [Candidatus Obscuribacter sp.]|nr:hypothetical protein [Candidatus Obscuribacter sp.]